MEIARPHRSDQDCWFAISGSRSHPGDRDYLLQRFRRADGPIKMETMVQVSCAPVERGWSEAEAIEAAKKGDAAAFEFLYQAHCKQVYGLCLGMLKRRSDAEELTREAFLHVFRRIGSFRSEAKFGTWLHRVTVDLVLIHSGGRR